MTDILVTGGSGQLGSALINRLIGEGHRVRAILRPGAWHPLLPSDGVEVVRGSFLDRETLDRAVRGTAAVFHLAGVVSYSPRDDREMYRVNADGAALVFEAALEAGVDDFVLASSTMAVGARRGGPPATEDAPFPPELHRIPYADSKRLGERYVLAGARRGMRVVVVNPSTITGAGEKLGNFKKLLLGARKRPLPVAPPGVSGVVDIADVVEGTLLAWEKGHTGRRYILNSENAPFSDLFHSVNRAAGHDRRPLRAPKAPLRALERSLSVLDEAGLPVQAAARGLFVINADRSYDAARARRELGWAPRVSLEQSMREAADHVFSHAR